MLILKSIQSKNDQTVDNKIKMCLFNFKLK